MSSEQQKWYANKTNQSNKTNTSISLINQKLIGTLNKTSQNPKGEKPLVSSLYKSNPGERPCRSEAAPSFENRHLCMNKWLMNTWLIEGELFVWLPKGRVWNRLYSFFVDCVYLVFLIRLAMLLNWCCLTILNGILVNTKSMLVRKA